VSSKKSKGLSRKQLKEKDQVLTGLEKAWHLLEKHAPRVLAVLIGGVLVTGVWALYGHCSYKSQAAASRQFNKALKAYNTPVIPESADETTSKKKSSKLPDSFPSTALRAKAAKKRFKRLVSEYGDGKLGAVALFYLANCHFQLEEYKKAIPKYEKFLAGGSSSGCGGSADTSPALKVVAMENLAYAYEYTQNLEKALKYFAKLEKAASGLKKEWALYHQARIWEKRNDPSKAIAMYRQVKVADPHAVTSPLRAMAERRARYLETGLADKIVKPEPRREKSKIKQDGRPRARPEKHGDKKTRKPPEKKPRRRVKTEEKSRQATMKPEKRAAQRSEAGTRPAQPNEARP
jgi:hypothetical protein